MNFFFKVLLDIYFSIKFSKHNKFYFKKKTFFKKKNNVILTEMVGMQSSQIPISYLLDSLSNKFKANIIAYNLIVDKNFFKVILWYLLKFFNLNDFFLYRSMGVDDFIYININNTQKKISYKLYKKILGKIKRKEDILKISIDNVYIGDLIYDHYLIKYKLPTIDVTSTTFKNFLLTSVEIYVFWKFFFKNHTIKALNVSHCVYLLAIPLRIAVKNKVLVYQTKYQSIHKFNKKHFHEYEGFKNFSKTFSLMTKKDRLNGIKLAKKLLIKKMSGKILVDQSESTKSAYFKKTSKIRVIKKSKRIKVLILTHCFFDSPHSYGKNIFVDFYEWIEFLGKMSNITNYDWYIKLHPDYLNGTKEIIDNFLIKYPKINYIPANISHHQIINEGINFALTVYGTVGAEYAYKKIPVINASINNPHISYNFNFHPKNLREYENLIYNLKKIKLKISISKVYEFYYMRNIHYWHNWLGLNYREFINKVGSYKNQFTYQAYKIWLKEFNINKHKSIIKTIDNFIKSNSNLLEYKHINN